jgi:hypothetical protein
MKYRIKLDWLTDDERKRREEIQDESEAIFRDRPRSQLSTDDERNLRRLQLEFDEINRIVSERMTVKRETGSN